MSSQFNFHVWAVPSESSAAVAAIKRCVPSPSSCPPVPYLPLASFKATEKLDSIVSKIRTFASSLAGPLVAEIGGTGTDNSSVFLKLEGSVHDLKDLHEKTVRHFGSPTSAGFQPHLIFCYGDEKTRVEVKRRAESDPTISTTLKTVEITTLQLVVGDSPKDFVFVGRVPFSSGAFLRDSMLIDGKFVSAKEHKRFQLVNPANKKIFHTVPSATKTDVEIAVQAAHRALPLWAKTPAAERARFLNAIADEIVANQNWLTEVEVIDNGKPWAEAEMDINDSADCFRYYAKLIVEKEKEHNSTPLDVGNPSFTCYVRREPVGVCGLIIPWNYPLLMAAWKVAPCLAAGCTAVLKPSELTPMTALELGAIVTKIGLPPGVLNIVTGFGPDAGSPLVDHPLVQKVAFTGSVLTGGKVATQAAKAIKKCTLELGGKSAIIVDSDVDIDQVADWVTMGIFFNAGQVCSATSRLIVHDKVKDQVLNRLKEVAESIKMGSGRDPSTKLGPVVNESQYKKVVSYIQGGIDQGCKVLTGGVPKDSDGYFIRPTILTGVKPDMTVWKEEIFGPVLTVMPYSDLDEAIRLANDTHFGLGAAVMSRNPETCKKVAHALQAGIVWVNCSQPTFVQAPWGGYKQSGIGRELGPWGLDNYLETKQVSAWVDQGTKGFNWFM